MAKLPKKGSGIEHFNNALGVEVKPGEGPSDTPAPDEDMLEQERLQPKAAKHKKTVKQIQKEEADEAKAQADAEDSEEEATED